MGNAAGSEDHPARTDTKFFARYLDEVLALANVEQLVLSFMYVRRGVEWGCLLDDRERAVSADFRAARSALLFGVLEVKAAAAPPGHGGVGEVGASQDW